MLRIAGFTAAALLAACGGPKGSDTNFVSALNSANEVGPNANTSAGTATATYTVSGTTVSYAITYSGLSGPPTQSHIHVGTDTVNGGVVVPFTGLPNAASGTFTGTFTAANIAAGTAGGVTINKNDLDSLLTAMRNGQAYTNIHTNARPGGEIRGQILPK
jgi:CHRD domain-containing protein